MSVRVYPTEPEPWPGPLWEPTIHDGKYPFFAQPGDIYVNRYPEKEKPPNPALYYLFIDRDNCVQVSREEVQAWVTGGLMKNPGRVRSNSQRGPALSKTYGPWVGPVE